MALQFTQGDNVILNLSATDGNGNAINITGATFSTQILGAAGAVQTFANAKHAIVSAPLGTFTLTLSAADTNACGQGVGKDLITALTISGNVTYYRGTGILTVFAPIPLQ